jgi:asparagine synthase (glutamine-hydrolysing)
MEGVRRLNGMFAFAIWDEKSQSLSLCRDHLGIKPLLYCWDGKNLVFASEIKGILQDRSIAREIDWNALGLYLTFNYLPAPHTIFKGINKMRPGHFIVLRDRQIEEKEFWNIDGAFSDDTTASNFPALKDKLFRTVEDAVRMQMIADVPLGAFLSGGIDSSIVVGLMARNSSRPINTFSIGYQDMPMFDETAYARAVADFNGTDHHEFKLTSQNIIEAIPHVLDSLDEPFADSSAIPTFVVSRETVKHVKVALSGDGGDELFAGYRLYRGEAHYARYRLLPFFLRRYLIEAFFLKLPDSRDNRMGEHIRRARKFLIGARYNTLEERFFAWNEIFSKDLRKDILSNHHEIDGNLGKDIMTARLSELKSDDAINRMLYADLKVSLPADMLRKVDSMSMLNSLEVRVPLLDRRLCELTFSIRGDLKIRRGQGKYVFIETFKKILPPLLHNRPKWGFEMPISQWLKTGLKYLIEENLSPEVIVRQGIFYYPAVKKLVDDLLSNRRDTSWKIWNLIVFQVWYARHIEHRRS